jgi:hypothetical protein
MKVSAYLRVLRLLAALLTISATALWGDPAAAQTAQAYPTKPVSWASLSSSITAAAQPAR